LLGYAREEYVGRPIAEFHVDPEVITEILARLGRGETVDAWRRGCAPGTARSSTCDLVHVLWEDGRFVHTRCFTRDITDRRRMEEAHRQADLLHHVASLAHAAATRSTIRSPSSTASSTSSPARGGRRRSHASPRAARRSRDRRDSWTG